MGECCFLKKYDPSPRHALFDSGPKTAGKCCVKKILYEWGKRDITKVEIFSEDIPKKPEIPTQGKFADAFDRITKNKRKKK